MTIISRLALGLMAVLVTAPAFAECPGHTSVSAQTQSAPAPVAQSTPESTAAPTVSNTVASDTVIVTQNQTQPTTPIPQE